jgi:PAS domain S-box-containing protein
MNRTAAEVVRSVVGRLASKASGALHTFGRPSPDLARLDTLVREVPGFVFRCATNVQRTLEYVSPTSRRLTGFDPHDLVGAGRVGLAALTHPEDRLRVQETLRREVLVGRPYRVAYRIRAVDGRERHVQEIAQPIATEAGVAIEGFVTELPELEDERKARLAEREEREAAGRSVAAAAHDLNNALGIIGVTADILGVERRGDVGLARDLADIASAVNRASSLTKQLSSLGRSLGAEVAAEPLEPAPLEGPDPGPQGP